MGSLVWMIGVYSFGIVTGMLFMACLVMGPED